MAIDSEPACEPAPCLCVACGQAMSPRRPVVRAEPDRCPFDLLRCGACGLVQQHPRYSARQIADLHGSDYYVFSEADSRRWARAVQQYAVHVCRWEAEPGRRFLDLGCALGHLAALAGHRGWRAVGLDISPEAVSRATGRFHIGARAGTLARHRETLPPFDLVFLGDVIEHAENPAELLREVRAALAPGGRVCIDTPNWASRWRRWGRRHWLGLNRFHINLFDAGALERLLASCGFHEITTGSYTNCRYENWAERPEVQAVVRRFPGPIAWRVNRLLAHRGGGSQWAGLRSDPPETLEASSRRVDAFRAGGEWFGGRSTQDNLIATARRD